MNALCRFCLRANIAWHAGLDAAFAAFGLRIVGMRWHPRGTEAKLYQAVLASRPRTIQPVIFDVGASDSWRRKHVHRRADHDSAVADTGRLLRRTEH